MKAGIYVFFRSYEKPSIFFERINLFYLQTTRVFHNLYQIADLCSEALDLSKTISGIFPKLLPRVCCAIEYLFLKRNLYRFMRNVNRTIFVRFDVQSDDCAEK